MALITSVVWGSQGTEPFLTCSIPDLQLDYIVFVLHRLKFEIDADRVEEIFIEWILCVS